jgi:uncharacterized membrane protein
VIGPRTVLALVVAGAAGGLLLVYLSSTGRLPPPVSVGVALTPLLVGALIVSWRSRWRLPVLFVALVAVAGAVTYRVELSRHVAALWLLQHVGGHAVLAIVFGRTLLPGEQPLATRVARAVLPSMPAEVVRYTRGVTLAWTIYFVTMAVLSLALYLGVGAEAWSTFATLVSGPLVALMFVLEFALRRFTVPASHRASIAQTVAGFRALKRTRDEPNLHTRPSHG